jgi:hypothetical protein
MATADEKGARARGFIKKVYIRFVNDRELILEDDITCTDPIKKTSTSGYTGLLQGSMSYSFIDTNILYMRINYYE